MPWQSPFFLFVSFRDCAAHATPCKYVDRSRGTAERESSHNRGGSQRENHTAASNSDATEQIGIADLKKDIMEMKAEILELRTELNLKRPLPLFLPRLRSTPSKPTSAM